MKKNICFIAILGMLLCNIACHQPERVINVGQEQVSEVIEYMTNLMVDDNTNPPLAARFFAYASLAGYEVVSQNNPSFKSMHGILNGYPLIKKPVGAVFNENVAALLAMIGVAKKMQPSGARFDSLERSLLSYFKSNGIKKKTLEGSLQYAESIAGSILAYAEEDGYRRLSNFPRYSPKPGKGFWFPTPPAYMDALEPYFNRVRTFYLDSSSLFIPPPPTPFSENKDTDFFKVMNEVYVQSKSTDPLHAEIASFWDCNPFAVVDKGHLQFGIKKISPGAHWMGIAGIAIGRQFLSFDSAMQAYTVLSTTLTDAFISCWDEKYRSDRIRPETVIRRYIDKSWEPLLQTPPFPEYPSGHSVVSTAAAVVLSRYFGENFAYTDTVERAFGLKDRHFTSFRQAAAEASISRLYGGIHFMDAITEGQVVGEAVGEYAIGKFFIEE
ncbi:MAG TPA: vanadium-dependent haloperoxidase [Flavitalea sp.]|nr:vanadium-dependent haloperoxidase [Flavitalea sp.]